MQKKKPHRPSKVGTAAAAAASGEDDMEQLHGGEEEEVTTTSAEKESTVMSIVSHLISGPEISKPEQDGEAEMLDAVFRDPEINTQVIPVKPVLELTTLPQPNHTDNPLDLSTHKPIKPGLVKFMKKLELMKNIHL